MLGEVFGFVVGRSVGLGNSDGIVLGLGLGLVQVVDLGVGTSVELGVGTTAQLELSLDLVPCSTQALFNFRTNTRFTTELP